MSKDKKEWIIPDIIYDVDSRKSYIKGRLFGKGAFAKCYEIRELKSHNVYAGKIVSKSIMRKNNQKKQIEEEIAIHRSLYHKNVVGFHGFFNDSHNIYIILELCRKRSMMELHKRRKTLTEYETRFYMKQILEGVHYLHQNRIIHRDLKLGNLFLNNELQVRIGDFGFATKLKHEGEHRKTLCGTPNYVAPEILNKVGHSFEVDVWSIGCIMYTLLVGIPPFETSSLKETFARIKQVQYKMPSSIAKPAMTMISSMLQGSPSKRPSVSKLIKDDFFSSGFLPQSLPLSCLTMAPRLDTLAMHNNRKALTEMNMNNYNSGETDGVFRVPTSSPPRNKFVSLASTIKVTEVVNDVQKANQGYKFMLASLKEQLHQVIKSKPSQKLASFADDEMTDPDAQPFVWISKWVDYSAKYGFGYQLSDDSVGVLYNDGTKIISLANGYNIHYIDQDGKERYYTQQFYPINLKKKMKLLNCFVYYMTEYLMKAGGGIAVKQSDSLSRIPYINQWFRAETAVVMQLTNGSVQINFQDHSKIIMCPLMAAVTYVDKENNFRTYRFQTIQQHGYCADLSKKLEYAYEKVSLMINNSTLR